MNANEFIDLIRESSEASSEAEIVFIVATIDIYRIAII